MAQTGGGSPDGGGGLGRSERAQISDFSYCLSSELDLNVRFKIGSVQGFRPRPSLSRVLADPYLRTGLGSNFPSSFSTGSASSSSSGNGSSSAAGATSGANASSIGGEGVGNGGMSGAAGGAAGDGGNGCNVYISCQPYAENKPLALPVRSGFKILDGNSLVWNEWVELPLTYGNLPASTQLVFTVWDVYAPRRPVAIAGTSFGLFGKNNTLRKGRHKLFLWPWKEADGSMPTTTPFKNGQPTEMDRIEKIMRKFDRADIPRIDWLDQLVFREVEQIHHSEASNHKNLYLYIDLPQFDFPVVFNEKEYVFAPNTTLRSLDSDVVSIYDQEMFNDNPIESKHRKLARSHRNGPLDRELKPNAKLRDELNKILRYPPTKALTAEEKDLLWKFRFFLTRDKKALTKFLKCVIWTDATEAKQASELLSVWVDIDVEDALELLGPTFEDGSVRAYAVMQLNKADDEELQLYLLQLVQALKFERLDEKTSILESPLVDFLIDRAIKNPILGNYLHWYLMVECEDKIIGKTYAKIAFQFMSAMVEMPDGVHRRDTLRRQGELVASIARISKELRLSKETRPKKIERLRSLIADPKNGLLSFPPLPLPLDAKVQVTGIVAEKANVFKSALLPLHLTFSCLDGTEYSIIFKTGDDLRQDQLVVQIITLMDRLLRKENLDLRLTPYKVLATGTDHGMLQFVPSKAIASILAEHSNSIVSFLKQTSSEGGGSTPDIPPHIMDTYIRSTSGYCVITYLLGIGDRHLDNLLLTQDGCLFHIDFGFILGRDPKPFPPPMKLCKEMVEAMGGAMSPNYQKFKSYAFIAFNSLRKSANLILNLFALMVNANIPDIALEPDKVVSKVQERFRLDLNDEEAIQYLQTLIIESVGAFFPQVMEQLHKVAQLWRS
ncbi:kinase-like domain-containing protein [Entophlyctis helioformis]|nr:kinase-like domain-containing protein [Entophlyctis helioformis]